ncbi:hypothetical protein GF340_02265 [Candidatus Peregrinibacteria bacterium]|nr:hypothetical protein [Candidatus Peregrinibacteria bacterium]
MSVRTQHEFLLIGRDEGSFVENYAYDIGEPGDHSGQIYVNLEIENNPADAEKIGEIIFDTLRRSFYADLEKDPYARFEDAVRDVNVALRQMTEEKASKFLGNLNVMLAAIVDNTLYLTQSGDAEAYLIRKRLCSTISEGLGDENSEEIFSNIASGTLEPGDFILFSSTRLLRYISKTDLSKIVSSKNIVASLTELKDYLSTEVLGRIGLIAAGVFESTPIMDENERGQIVEHLQKEESYSRDPGQKTDVMKSLQDSVKKLTGVVADLKDKVVGAVSKNKERVVRGDQTRASKMPKLDFFGLSAERMLAIIIILILVLVGGIWWMRSNAANQARIEELDNQLGQVQDLINSAETTGQYSKEQAGTTLNNAEQQALEVLNSGYHRAKANQLLEQIQVSRDTLDGVIRPEYRVVADLSTERENVNALGLLSLNDALYAYEYNGLYPILLDDVQDPLTIDENESVTMATVYDDNQSILFMTESNKIIEYKDDRMTFIDTVDGAFKDGVDLSSYGNRIYVLNPEDNQIWRYTRTRDRFDSAEAYNVDADLTNSVSLAIDGNIFVLNTDGTVVKIFRGNKEDGFRLNKLPVEPIENPTDIYTELDMSQVYILEPSKQRVLVFYKDNEGQLTYNNQYVLEDLTDIRDIYVDKDTNKIYLLDQSKVYELQN